MSRKTESRLVSISSHRTRKYANVSARVISPPPLSSRRDVNVFFPSSLSLLDTLFSFLSSPLSLLHSPLSLPPSFPLVLCIVLRLACSYASLLHTLPIFSTELPAAAVRLPSVHVSCASFATTHRGSFLTIVLNEKATLPSLALTHRTPCLSYTY